MELQAKWVDEGCAMGNVGNVVLGYWYVPFNLTRIRECGERYRLAAAATGSFSVLTVFRVNPYSADAIGSAAREQIRDLLQQHGPKLHLLVSVMQGSPLLRSAMRLSAAATTLLTGSRALRFVSSVDEAYELLAAEPSYPPRSALAAGLRTLEADAAATAAAGVCNRVGRPTW